MKNRQIPFIVLSALFSMNVIAQGPANAKTELIVGSAGVTTELSEDDIKVIEEEIGVKLAENEIILIKQLMADITMSDVREVVQNKKGELKAIIKVEALKVKEEIKKMQISLKEKLKHNPKSCEMLPSAFGHLVVTNKKTYGPFASILPEQNQGSISQRLLTKVDSKRRSAAEFMNKHCEMTPVDCQIEALAEGFQINVKEGISLSFPDAQSLLAGQVSLEQQNLCNPFPVPQCEIKNSGDDKGFELKIGDKIQFSKVEKSDSTEENIKKLIKLKEIQQSVVDSGFCVEKPLEVCSIKNGPSTLSRDPRHALQISSELSVWVQGSNKVEDVARFTKMRKMMADKGLCLDSGVNQCSIKYSTGDLSHNGIKVFSGDTVVGFDYQGMMSHADQFNKLKELSACEVDEEKLEACKVVIAPSDEGEGYDGTITTEGVGQVVVLGNILMRETNDSFENIFMKTGAASMRLMSEKMCASISVEIIKREDVVDAEMEESVIQAPPSNDIIDEASHASEEIAP